MIKKSLNLIGFTFLMFLAISGSYLMLLGLTSSQSRAPESSIVLTTKNTVVIRGVIDGASMSEAQQDLHSLNVLRGKKDYPIYIVLDTPGGSIDAGVMFIDFAKSIRNVKTITIEAASMGAMIVEVLPGERLITDSSTLMFHRASVRLGGQISEGEVESQLAFIKKLVKNINEKVAKRLQISYEEYQAKIVNELWLYSDEILQNKAADRKVELSCSNQLIDKRIKKVVTFMIFQDTLTFSGCPLFRAPLGG